MTTHNTESEPYKERLVTSKLRVIKDILPAHAVGILTNIALKRGMLLINNPSRVVRTHDVHELACTTQDCKPGESIDSVGYLAFIVFNESGVVAIEDTLFVEGNKFGKVIGFNEAHAPNHINIVIQVDELTTGLQAGWKPGTRLFFKITD